MRRASYTSVRRSARTSDASWRGIRRKKPGTAPATARGSASSARSSTGLRTSDCRKLDARVRRGRFFTLDFEFFGLDLDALALDVEAQSSEQAHVDVRHPHEREPSEDGATPVGNQQAIASA